MSTVLLTSTTPGVAAAAVAAGAAASEAARARTRAARRITVPPVSINETMFPCVGLRGTAVACVNTSDVPERNQARLTFLCPGGRVVLTAGGARMADIEALLTDLDAESADADRLVADLPPGRWAAPTPAAGWTVA